MIRKLYFTICLLAFMSLSSCSKSDECTIIEFDTPFQFQEGDSFCVGTDIEFEIRKVDDQRCPCDVVCVWEGEFVFEMVIKSGNEEEEYFLHEKIENAPTENLGLEFTEIIMISDDSCENMIDIDKIIFEMQVSQ